MMTIHRPKKFALIGSPGGGKSTFASRLGEILKIPVHHLDRHMFEPGGKKRDKQEFIEIQKTMLNEEAWVVEGRSFSTFEMRFKKANIVIYFQFFPFISFLRLSKRIFRYRKEHRSLRFINLKLLRYTWNFDREKRERIEELRMKYPEILFVILKNQERPTFNLNTSA